MTNPAYSKYYHCNAAYNFHDVRKPIFVPQDQKWTRAEIEFYATGRRQRLIIEQHPAFTPARTHAFVYEMTPHDGAKVLPCVKVFSWISEGSAFKSATQFYALLHFTVYDLEIWSDDLQKWETVGDFAVEEGMMFRDELSRVHGIKRVVTSGEFEQMDSAVVPIRLVEDSIESDSGKRAPLFRSTETFYQSVWGGGKPSECMWAFSSLAGQISGDIIDHRVPDRLLGFLAQLPAWHEYLQTYFHKTPGEFYRLSDRGVKTLAVHMFRGMGFLYVPKTQADNNVVAVARQGAQEVAHHLV